jgi:integrase
VATIEPYETQAGQRYRVRYRTPENRSTSKRGFRTKKEAALFAAQVEVDMARGEYVNPSAGKATVAELGPALLATKRAHLKPSAYRPLEIGWRLRTEPKWGRVPIAKITHSAVQSWIDEMVNEGLSATVVLRDYGFLLNILDGAVRNQLIPRHHARGVKLPKKKRKKNRYLSHAQVALFADQAKQWGDLIETLAYTGIRWGEMAALRVGDVTFVPRRFDLYENAVQVGHRFMLGTLKNGEDRSVPFPAFLDNALRARMAGRPADHLLFGEGADGYLKTPHNQHGWFLHALKRAQKIDSSIPSITPHDLRHTAASLAISSGANVKVIQKMLGHKSAAMTLDIYGELFDDDLDAVGVALDQARADSIVSNTCPDEGLEEASAA